MRIYALFFFVIITIIISAQPPEIEFTEIASGLTSPVAIACPKDGSGRLFIVEQSGSIRIYEQNANQLLATPFLTIPGVNSSGNEMGLLGIAFHPDYVNNGYFFVNYTYSDGEMRTKVARYRANPPSSNTAGSSEFPIISFTQPYSNHNGGDLKFGPDGYLYIATGDGGDGGDPENRAQNGNSLLGKLLRIDPSIETSPGSPYEIPANNPFVDDNTVLDEIWALGLRNPWRFSFDKMNGDLWIADVGQSAREEVNRTAAGSEGGENYGWRCYEGSLTYNTNGCLMASNYTFPIWDIDRDTAFGARSITGGFVYRGIQYPDLQGYYICADYITDNVWRINTGGIAFLQKDLVVDISSFGENETGELFAVSRTGSLYAISSELLPVELVNFDVEVKGLQSRIWWETVSETNNEGFEIQRLSNDGNWKQIAFVPGAGYHVGYKSYTYIDQHPEEGINYYRIRQIDLDGSFQFTEVKTVYIEPLIRFFPNPVNDFMQLPVTESFLFLELINKQGIVLLENQNGAFNGGIPFHLLPPDTYFIHYIYQGIRRVEKIIKQ